jgi:hypothetical protein
MKKISKIIASLLFITSLMLFSGCDNLSDIPLNIPIGVEFSLSGNETSLEGTTSFCLNQYKEWTDNKDALKSVSFISTSYWTKAVTPSDLSGTINIALKGAAGEPIFNVTMKDVALNTFINKPYKIVLTKAEIDAFNGYLDGIKEGPDCTNPSFTAEINISNITGSTSPYNITGKIEIVLEAVVEP